MSAGKCPKFGEIVKFVPGAEAPEAEMTMTVPGAERFVAIRVDRNCPYWSAASVGSDLTTLGDLATWLLVQLKDGSFTLYVALPAATQMHFMKGGPRPGTVQVCGETGDPSLVCAPAAGLYSVKAKSPSLAIRRAASDMLRLLPAGTVRLRSKKPDPDMLQKFGWCTWNAFYNKVTLDDVRAGLSSWTKAGFMPDWMILDDGWMQTVEKDGKRFLTGFDANEKFPGGLKATVDECKNSFGLNKFFVWHAVSGYWDGVLKALPGYRFAPRETICYTPGATGGERELPPSRPDKFFEAYHAHLAACGVDGVKIDNQWSLSGLGSGAGGRAKLFADFRSAMNKSTGKHFGQNFLTCMSANPEALYHCKSANLFRGSDDFFPERPEMHGRHIYQNALMGLWFGNFMWVDWDMFTTDDPSAPFHAAARAISGGPVYTADKPGVHQTAILDSLLLSGGRVPRCLAPARVADSCLFFDPRTPDAGLFKVVNSTACGAVMGLFNCKYDGKKKLRTRSSFSLADVGCRGDHAIWMHNAGKCLKVSGRSRPKLALCSGEAEVVSFAKIDENGFAVLGLKRLFNATGSVESVAAEAGRTKAEILDGGEVLAWAAARPASVKFGGKSVPFSYDAESGAVTFTIPRAGSVEIAK